MPHVGKRSRCHHSAVTNGTRLFTLADLDGRSTVARRIKDLIAQISADRGGKDDVSTAELQLIRRAASLCVMAELIEADMARELPFDINAYGMITVACAACLKAWAPSAGLAKSTAQTPHSPITSRNLARRPNNAQRD